MQISALKERLRSALVDFAWRQWSQMGVLAATDRRDVWAQDPEALIVFSLEVGRDDPRLFDELLNWLVVNGDLVSRQRLANLCPPADRTRPVVDAALAWAGEQGSRLGPLSPPNEAGVPEPLFHSITRVPDPDDVFLRFGFAKPPAGNRLRSSPPDRFLPVNIAFRLRDLLGVSARAEIIRFLLASRARDATVLAVAEAASYAKRNVAEALGQLARSDFVTAFWIGNEGRYGIELDRWAQLLETEPADLPLYRPWPTLLSALRDVSTWSRAPDLDAMSDYLLASRARDLMESVGPRLSSSGVKLAEKGIAVDYWASFTETVENALGKLEPPEPSPSTP